MVPQIPSCQAHPNAIETEYLNTFGKSDLDCLEDLFTRAGPTRRHNGRLPGSVAGLHPCLAVLSETAVVSLKSRRAREDQLQRVCSAGLLSLSQCRTGSASLVWPASGCMLLLAQALGSRRIHFIHNAVDCHRSS